MQDCNTTDLASVCTDRPYDIEQALHTMLGQRRLFAAHALMQQRASQDAHLEDLQQQAKHLATLLAELSTSTTDWTPMNNTLNLKTWHKQQQTQHSIRAAMVFPNARVDQPLTMGWEFDLVKTWNSYATATHILQVCQSVTMEVQLYQISSSTG